MEVSEPGIHPSIKDFKPLPHPELATPQEVVSALGHYPEVALRRIVNRIAHHLSETTDSVVPETA